MEGWGWEKVHDPTILPKVVERWKASLAKPFHMEFPIRRKDGAFETFVTRTQFVFICSHSAINRSLKSQLLTASKLSAITALYDLQCFNLRCFSRTNLYWN